MLAIENIVLSKKNSAVESMSCKECLKTVRIPCIYYFSFVHTTLALIELCVCEHDSQKESELAITGWNARGDAKGARMPNDEGISSARYESRSRETAGADCEFE